MINIHDDALNIVLENLQDGRDQLTPFYITLELQNFHFQHCLYDLRASHCLILVVVMENLGFDIARPGQDLFDSKRVQILRMIMNSVVTVVHIPRKFVVMHLVITDVSPTYGMLPSKHSGTFKGGIIQFDISYAIFPIFGSDTHYLYREPKMLAHSMMLRIHLTFLLIVFFVFLRKWVWDVYIPLGINARKLIT